MLPGLRFLLAAIVLAVSVLVFGVGAAALLRAAHEEFAGNPSWRSGPQEQRFAQAAEPVTPVLAALRAEAPGQEAEPARAEERDGSAAELGPGRAEPTASAAPVQALSEISAQAQARGEAQPQAPEHLSETSASIVVAEAAEQQDADAIAPSPPANAAAAPVPAEGAVAAAPGSSAAAEIRGEGQGAVTQGEFAQKEPAAVEQGGAEGSKASSALEFSPEETDAARPNPAPMIAVAAMPGNSAENRSAAPVVSTAPKTVAAKPIAAKPRKPAPAKTEARSGNSDKKKQVQRAKKHRAVVHRAPPPQPQAAPQPFAPFGLQPTPIAATTNTRAR